MGTRKSSVPDRNPSAVESSALTDIHRRVAVISGAGCRSHTCDQEQSECGTTGQGHIVTHLDADDLDKYAVVEAPGDRIRSTEWFDSDDLATALEVLDRRWIVLGGPHHNVETSTTAPSATTTQSPTATRSDEERTEM
jgi:hypothetical protein